MDINLDMITGKLNLTDVDSVPPEQIIAKYGEQIESITNGIVRGVVSSYTGPIETDPPDILNGIRVAIEQEHDIQDDLGAIGYTYSTFDFVLTAPDFPHYKYRVFFFEYGIGGYPVKLILEQAIADAINSKSYSFCLKNREELIKMMNLIFNSSKVIEVVQDLINAAMIAQSKNILNKSSPQVRANITD